MWCMTPRRVMTVEMTVFLSKFSEVIAEQGLAGMVIVILLISNVALWRALQKKNKRVATLVDRMLTMAEEVNIMIERITGR